MLSSDEIAQVSFYLPTPIWTYCANCEKRLPFNPAKEQTFPAGSAALPAGTLTRQVFALSYECQGGCGEPIVFLVKRGGSKLQVGGRSVLEAVPLPNFIPKVQARYFSDAKVAHNAGQTMAGLFLLRTFIEQFWLSVPRVVELREALLKAEKRASGEELGAAYNETLPEDFKDRFPSLVVIYGKLSEAMHEAEAKAELFEGCTTEIEKHFDARRLYGFDKGA